MVDTLIFADLPAGALAVIAGMWLMAIAAWVLLGSASDRKLPAVPVPMVGPDAPRVVATLSRDRSDDSVQLMIPHGLDLGLVRRAVFGACEACPSVLAAPKPELHFRRVVTEGTLFELRITAQTSEIDQARADVALAVYEALIAAGVEVPFDQLVVRQFRAA